MRGRPSPTVSLSKGAKSAASAEKKNVVELRKSLLSIGVDKASVEKLIASNGLDRIIAPIYWKDGLVFHVSSLALSSLPGFLKSFEKEFPDGQVRWDRDYDETNPKDGTSDVAIRVTFSYQEDDQGDHWSPKPTLEEEESYQGMLKRHSYKGPNPVRAHAVLKG
jgi:hypothetical protein